MPRARKQTVVEVVVAPEVKVPEVLITRQQYIEDIKVRWAIHQYEVNKLRDDLSKVTQTVAPYVKTVLDFAEAQYQQIRSRFVTA